MASRLEAAGNSSLVAQAASNAALLLLSSGVLDSRNFVGFSGEALYFSTIAGNFCAMQNVLPKLKLNFSSRGSETGENISANQGEHSC